MAIKNLLHAVLLPSQDVVAREIEGEIIIVPLTSGIGDLEDEIYTLNETGKDIWNLLDGKQTLQEVFDTLSDQFEAPKGEIERDLLGLAEELLKRRIIVEAPEN